MLGGHVDVLTGAGAAPFGERGDGVHGGLGGGVVEGLRLGDAHRGAVGVAVQHQLSAGRGERQVARRPARLRPAPAERGDGHHDQPGVVAPQAVEVEVERAALDHDVGGRGQRVDLARPARDHQPAPLVGVVPERVPRVPVVARERAGAPAGVPARWLDGDDLGAELGEEQAGEHAAVVGQIEHPVWRQHDSPSSPGRQSRMLIRPWGRNSSMASTPWRSSISKPAAPPLTSTSDRRAG